MGTGYTRNDTDNNIADGNVINAADFDGEFDAIVTAFSTSGHTHDGTSAEGGPVSVVGPAQDITVSATIVSPKSNNAIDLGTSSLSFKDLFINTIKVIVDADADDLTGDSAVGRITLGASEDLNLYHGGTNSYIVNDTGDLILDTADDIVLDADGGDVFLKDAGTQYAALTNTSGNLIIKSGSTTALTFSGANVTAAGILKTDDATDATSTTDGSLQTDGGLSVAKDAVLGNDLKLLSDASVLSFGADSEITVTHVADTGLTITNTNTGDNKPIVIQLKSEENEITANEVIGSIEFAAGDDSGTDAATVAAGIHAIAEAEFTSSVNSTKLVFTTGASETAAASATAKMTLSSTGDLTIADDLFLDSDNAVLSFGDDGDTTLTHTDGSGLTLNSTNKIMFNDASQFIQGSSGTVLSLGATDEIDLTATDIDINGTLDVSGSAVFNTSVEVVTSDNSTQLTLKSTDADASVGPVMVFERESASAAGDDEIGRILFVGRNSENNADVTYGSIETHINAAAAASAGGYMKFRVASHDGETQSGLEIRDGNAEDEVDVTIGNAVGSLTTIKGDVLLDHDGAVLSIGADSDLKITHDGSNGDFESAGDLTFDVAGDITLDVSGGDVRIAADGTQEMQFKITDGANVDIISTVQDDDMRFRGNDGGSTITALTLDMSDAGTAIFNNQIQGASGAVSAPTFAFSNDTNTGMTRPTGDTVTLVTGGAEGIRVDSSQNTNVFGSLVVGATGGNSTGIIQGSSGAGSTNQPGTDLQLKGGAGGGTGGSNIKFFTAPGGSSGTSESAAVERMRINTDGFVGVGATNQDAPLTIQPAAQGVGTNVVQNWMYSLTSSSEFDLKLNQVVSSGLVQYSFTLRNNGTSFTDNLVLDRGNVGIGTSSPAKNLEIRTDAGDEGILVKSTGDTSNEIAGDANRTSADAALLGVTGKWNGTSVGQILFQAGADTTNKDDGFITFRTSSADNIAERMRIDSSGNVKIDDGDLIIGTSGHGIDFSATGDGSGSMTSELLDDYEEGSWAPVITPEGGSAAGLSVNHATYTKIGRMVFVAFDVKITSISGNTSSAAIELTGLPYARNTTSAGGPNIGYTSLNALGGGNLALQGNSTTKYRIVNLNLTTGDNASDHLAVNSFLRGQFSYNT